MGQAAAMVSNQLDGGNAAAVTAQPFDQSPQRQEFIGVTLICTQLARKFCMLNRCACFHRRC
jgi:hypothetical protein